MRSHRYLEDVVTSDLAFEVRADSLPDLFVEAGVALTEAMVDIRRVRPRIIKTIRLDHKAVDQLLFDWLAELIYLKDAEYMVFSDFRVDLKTDPDGVFRLAGRVRGERIRPDRHNTHMDVKAVTYHLFEVSQKDGQWVARVVLDI